MYDKEKMKENARKFYQRKRDALIEKINKAFDNDDWKPIPNYEDYRVSRDGEIVNKFGKKLKPAAVHINGYRHVCLAKKGFKPKHVYVHQAVWWAFNGEVPNGLYICHKTDNIEDNSLDNLVLRTIKENLNKPSTLKKFKERKNDARGIGRKKRKVYQYDLDGNLINTFESVKSTRLKGFTVHCVSLCCNGKLKTHKGYIFSQRKMNKTRKSTK